MRIVEFYTKFIYPFNLAKNTSRAFILRRLLTVGRWVPKIYDVTAKERKLRSKPYDQLRTEYFLPYVRRYLFPTVSWDEKRISNFRKFQE